MGQTLKTIREFCKRIQDLGIADRERIRRELDALVEDLVAVLQFAPEELAQIREASARRLSAHRDDVAASLIAALEQTFGAELTEQERQPLASVPIRWELISQAIEIDAQAATWNDKTDKEVAREFFLTIGTLHQMLEYQFLGWQGHRLQQVATCLAKRLGISGDDRRVKDATLMGAALKSAAWDQVRTAFAIRLLSLTGEGEPDAGLIAWVVSLFGPGKAMEAALQQRRAQSADRSHLDRVSLALAWSDVLEIPWGQKGLWWDQVLLAARHRLRETYKGEAGPWDREMPTEKSELDRIQQELYVQPEAAATAGEGELPERIARNLAKLTPAQRLAVMEFLQAVRRDAVTLSGKLDDSLRQLWPPAQYDRKRRALHRGLSRLRELDATDPIGSAGDHSAAG